MLRKLIVLEVLLIAVLITAVQAQTSTCSVADTVLPTGQVSPSPSGDPLIPTYCVPPPAVQPATRVTGANDWVDSFNISGIGRFNDGDMDYRVFDQVGGVGPTKHLVVGDHWIVDDKIQFSGGAMLRPNRTFHAENGKLVIEGDVAAGKDVYSGNLWAEFVISTAPQPDINPPDPPEQIYAYGRFKGFPTFGCRLQDARANTCAGFTGSTLPFPPTEDKPPCFSLSPDRLWELSSFQDCGTVHFGGDPTIVGPNGPLGNFWRVCSATQDYDPCLDRFRIELTATSLVLYVNGYRYFEDSGWDTLHQAPAALFSGPVYVYFADWAFIDPNPVYRFHWERLAVNPHAANGTLLPPSASPSFGTPTATLVPVSTATSSPTATRTATPTGVCSLQVVYNGTPIAVPQPLHYCQPQAAP